VPDMTFVRKFPGECCAEVSRKGNSEPCDKTAYAVAVDPDDPTSLAWPVCVHHARGRTLIPLSELLEVARA
jgi:hypothetical protein